MIRRYNYTGRKKLLSGKIKITEWVKKEVKYFTTVGILTLKKQ